MRRVSAKYVPRLLTDVQKENRVEISKELLANANGNENFLKNIITGDETRVYVCDVETKMQSSMWMVLLDQKTQMSSSQIKVILVVYFHWKGIVQHEFVPRGQMVNKQFYRRF